MFGFVFPCCNATNLILWTCLHSIAFSFIGIGVKSLLRYDYCSWQMSRFHLSRDPKDGQKKHDTSWDAYVCCFFTYSASFLVMLPWTKNASWNFGPWMSSAGCGNFEGFSHSWSNNHSSTSTLRRVINMSPCFQGTSITRSFVCNLFLPWKLWKRWTCFEVDVFFHLFLMMKKSTAKVSTANLLWFVSFMGAPPDVSKTWGCIHSNSCQSSGVCEFFPENLTNVPWKSMVGRCISYWNSPFFRGHVSFGGCMSLLLLGVFKTSSFGNENDGRPPVFVMFVRRT